MVDRRVYMRICKRFRFALIFENYFVKIIENFFRVHIASSKHSEGWENSQLSSCLDEAMQTPEKVPYCLIRPPLHWELLHYIFSSLELIPSYGGIV